MVTTLALSLGIIYLYFRLGLYFDRKQPKAKIIKIYPSEKKRASLKKCG